MHIGIEAQRIYKKEKHGIEYVAIELIKHLQQIDKENQYTVFVKEGEDSSVISETENFNIKVLKKLPYPVWEQFSLSRAIKNAKIDILHCTANTGPVLTNTPIILTLHDIFFIESIHFKGTVYQNFGNIYRNLIVRQLIKKAVNITTVSNEQKKQIERRFPSVDSKISVIHNGLSTDFTKIITENKSKEIYKKYNLPSNFNLFLGNKDPRKNSGIVIKSYIEYLKKYINPIPLVCPGLPSEYIDKQIKYTDESNLIQYFICPGYIDKADFPNVMRSANCLLIPSKKEGFGLPILEAMASGTPVITSNVSTMPEIAGDAALFVNPESSESITNALLAISSDRSIRSELINKGKTRCMQFSWKTTAKKYLQTYNKFAPIPKNNNLATN